MSKFSAIVPAYNVEQYLAECLDSLLDQDIDMEIIIVNDGSSDSTGEIAERYEKGNKNIRVIHQTNSGLSAARNKGFDVAQGEYIVLVDSDDWIAKGVLTKLYKVATAHQADMVMGNHLHRYPDGSEKRIFSIPAHLKNQLFTGDQCFVSLMETGTYYPMAWSYIYRQEWIKKNNLSFSVGIIHEDEAWTPIALCRADRVVLTDLDFYYYRMRYDSIMHSLNHKVSSRGLFHATERLIAFAEELENREESGVLKSWVYANVFRILNTVYKKLVLIKDSTFMIPDNNLADIYDQAQEFLPLKAKEKYENYYLTVKEYEENYLKWKNNPWDRSIFELSNPELREKRIILVYNNPEWYDYEFLAIDDFPSDYVITFDRKYISQAYAIVFYLPDLHHHLENDLEKPDSQVWVAWSEECEENDPWRENKDFSDLFDIWMTYHEASNIADLYYTGSKKEETRDTNPFLRLCAVLSKFNQ